MVRKPKFCICENKDADQLRGNCEADQRLCFHYLDSTIPLLPKSKISSLQPLQWLYSLVCVRLGQNSNCWFSHAGAHFNFAHCMQARENSFKRTNRRTSMIAERQKVKCFIKVCSCNYTEISYNDKALY